MERMERKKKQVWIAYARRSSTESQRRQHISIPAQLADIHRSADRYNANVLLEYSDSQTAANFNRPGLQKAFEFCQRNKHVTHLVCTEVSRFGREGAEFLQWVKKFQQVGVEVNFTQTWYDFTVPETTSIFYFHVGNAEAERLRISKRTRESKQAIRMAGYYADTPPLPWKYGNREPNGRAPLIRSEAFERCQAAIQKFADENVTQAECWRMYGISRSVFSRLLSNPLIMGYIEVNGELIQCKAPPLISRTTFYQIQHKLQCASAKPKIHKLYNEDFPAKPLYFCPDCLGSLRAYYATGRHGGKYGYYDCKHGHYRLNSKKAHSRIADALNTLRLREAFRANAEAAAKSVLSSIKAETSKKIEQYRKAIHNADLTISKLQQDYHRLDIDVFSDMMRTAKDKRMRAEAALEEARFTRSLQAQQHKKLVSLLDNLGDWYNQADPEYQHRLLKMLMPEGFTLLGYECRTPRLNEIVAKMCYIADVPANEKRDKHGTCVLVPGADATGTKIEPDLLLIQQFLVA